LAACLFVEGPKDSDVKQAYGLATSGWLTRELAEQRWEALHKAATNRHYVGELLRMTVDLDAFREGLRPKAGDWNRGWNMTLLTLMQRAGVLRVLSIPTQGDQPEFAWTIEILQTAALEGVNDELWEAISDLRDGELADARAALDPFVAVMRHPNRACVTRTAFELIEPHAFAPPCGRCPACRESGVIPPLHLISAGLEKRWPNPSPQRGALPADTILVNPDDPELDWGFSNLVRLLATAGVDQMVVPHELADKAAQVMAQSSTRLGLVLDSREWTGDAQLAQVPTAVILAADPAQAGAMLDRVDDFRKAGTVPLLVVTRPDRNLRGRRVADTLSQLAPYGEAQILALAGATGLAQ
jgi:ATP-dependent DNA helicase RecQ